MGLVVLSWPLAVGLTASVLTRVRGGTANREAEAAVAVRDGNEVRVPVEDVVVGDAVRVAAGDQILADGTLVKLPSPYRR